MRFRGLAAGLLGAASLIVGPALAPDEALAQSPPRSTTPPTPPRRPVYVKPPPQLKDDSAERRGFERTRLDAELSARLDSALASADRLLALTRGMNAQMSELETPQTFQNLGQRFDLLQLHLRGIVRYVRALHAARDDPWLQREIRASRMESMGALVDGIERILKETTQMQSTLEQTMLP